MAVEALPLASRGNFSATTRYRNYVLALLIAVGVFGWVDRNVLAMLLESIKLDLKLSDTELGLLGGAAFGVFYATVGLPVAWLADRYSRRSLIALALCAWSVMTALCGAAGSFATLFLARVGVGVGEAGGSPPSQSLVADYFPPQRRAAALGVLYLFMPIGFLIGYAAGGWLDETIGWRLTFAVIGLPGVALAAIVRLTLREPPRGYAEHLAEPATTPSLQSTVRYCVARRSLRHLPLAGAVYGIGAFAAAVWLPSYFIRSFGVSTVDAGLYMALAYGCGGGVGVLAGGYLADLLVERTGDARWYAWGSAAVVAAALPVAATIYLTDSIAVAGACLLFATMLSHMFVGPVTALVQNLAELRRRAVTAALYLFLVNLLSMGLGPLAVGIVSDRLGARLGVDSLRYALLTIVIATSILACAHFVTAARTLRRDLELVQKAGQGT